MSCPMSRDTRVQLVVRRFAGTFVLASLALSKLHSPNWLWFTAFVGANLIQSSFTNFCPLEMILRRVMMKGKARDALAQPQA